MMLCDQYVELFPIFHCIEKQLYVFSLINISSVHKKNHLLLRWSYHICRCYNGVSYDPAFQTCPIICNLQHSRHILLVCHWRLLGTSLCKKSFVADLTKTRPYYFYQRIDSFTYAHTCFLVVLCCEYVVRTLFGQSNRLIRRIFNLRLNNVIFLDFECTYHI